MLNSLLISEMLHMCRFILINTALSLLSYFHMAMTMLFYTYSCQILLLKGTLLTSILNKKQTELDDRFKKFFSTSEKVLYKFVF